MDWFAVDKEGLAALLERRGKPHAILELLQNSFDENGVTKVTVTLEPASMRGRSLLFVEDDAPDGFADLTHAFTLFAPSKKIADTTKRGRFNFGEKLVLSICDEATVVSTTGGFLFSRSGRKALRRRREAGSEFGATIRLTADERAEFERLVHTVLVPPGIEVTFNGQSLLRRTPLREFETTLRTEVADEDGILRSTKRKTQVRLFEPVGDETPTVYEMGIPVVEHDGKWHLDVGQKVPLSFERDNITPAYRRDLHVAVLNEAHDLIDTADASATWVKDATADPRAEDAAVQRVITQRFGDKVVAWDPSDPQANNEAALQGYAVVPGGALSGAEWEQVRRSGAMRPAGQVTPSNSTVITSPDGIPPIPFDDWTDGMVTVAAYSVALAKELLGVDIKVDIHRVMQSFRAAYGGRYLAFNLMRLGHRFFDSPDQKQIDALLLHEFAHEKVSNHLSEDFHAEICRLGARLREVSLRLDLEAAQPVRRAT